MKFNFKYQTVFQLDFEYDFGYNGNKYAVIHDIQEQDYYLLSENGSIISPEETRQIFIKHNLSFPKAHNWS